MSWKSLFVKEDENEKEVPQESPRVTTPAKTVQFGNTGISNVPVATTGTDYNSIFDSIIADAKVESPGYKEFSKVLDKMKDKPYTDQQKYENTFLSFETMGVTPDRLIKTGEKLIEALESSKPEFENEISQSEQSDVIAKQEEAKKLQVENDEMTKKIQENAKRIQELSNESIQASQHLAAEKQGFMNTLEARIQIIKNNIANIKLYLNVTTK